MFAPVSAWAHSVEIRLRRYIDDWLVLADSVSELQEALNRILKLCQDLGIVVNFKKSDLEPKNRAKYLGLVLDSVLLRAFPTEARITKFMEVSATFMALQSPPARLWQIVLGHMASLEKLVLGAQLRMRSLQFALRGHWSASSDPPLQPVPLTEECLEDLRWWREEGRLSQGVPLMTPPPEMHLFTNASLEGWGAHLQELVVSGVWTQDDQDLHINLLEMRAVLLGLQVFQD